MSISRAEVRCREIQRVVRRYAVVHKVDVSTVETRTFEDGDTIVFSKALPDLPEWSTGVFS